MSKKKNGIGSIIKDTFALLMITAVAAVLLGYVREITAEPIAKRAEEDKQKAYLAVYEQAASVVESKDVPELRTALAKASEILTADYASVTIDEACLAKDASGNTIGYILTVTDKKGYGGAIQMVLGYSCTDAFVTGIEFLTINETAGFGLEAEKNPEWRTQYYGVPTDAFTVTKSGRTTNREIDAISGATITSKAVTEGINGGLLFGRYLTEQGIGGVK